MAGDQGNWGPAILALTIAFLVVVFLFLFLRIVTRVWIVHQFWWDDAAITLAVVCASQRYFPPALLNTTCCIARNHYRRRPRFRRSQLRLWQTPAIPHFSQPPRVSEVHLRRVDSDICDAHVDQSFYMPILDAATQQQSTTPTAAMCRGVSTLLQHHFDHHMDHAVPAHPRSMG